MFNKKTIFIIIILTFSFSLAKNKIRKKNIPHYMTPAEKSLYAGYRAPFSVRGNTFAPPTAVRTMAEWEKLNGIMVTWTSYYDILTQVIGYAQEEGWVYIVCEDSNQVKNYLTRKGVPLKNLKFLIQAYDTVWCRDYGPWTAYAKGTDSLDIIDWIYNRPRPEDDVIPAAFADFIGVPEYEATQAPDDLVHTGGNFMVDGHGTGFSSKLILNENSDKTEAQIDDIMQRYLGLNRYIKMDALPYDQIHHIDMHMKLLDEETLLVGQYPEGVADGPQIEANLQYILDNFNTCYGNPYRVVRIPMPPDAQGRYPDQDGDYRTYTNSLIVNKTVIIPTYEEKYDTTAFRIYRQAMPGYHIVGINCNDIITALGAIHCITKEVGVRNPIFISHNPLRQMTDNQDSIRFIAQITTNSGIDSALVYWTTDTTSGFSAQRMKATKNDSFYAAIPNQASGSEVFYYLSATSRLGKTICKPLVAPEGTFSFTVEGTSSIGPRTAAAPQSFELFQNYPNPFNPTTRISYTVETIHPSSLPVELTVYNILGQQVKTLVHEKQSAGKYTILFDGSHLAGGVYFYRLKSKRRQITRKMILLP